MQSDESESPGGGEGRDIPLLGVMEWYGQPGAARKFQAREQNGEVIGRHCTAFLSKRVSVGALAELNKTRSLCEADEGWAPPTAR